MMGCLGRTQVISNAFERMRQKVLDTETYAAAVKELSEFITGEEIERQFSELEKADIEKELAQLKARISGCSGDD